MIPVLQRNPFAVFDCISGLPQLGAQPGHKNLATLLRRLTLRDCTGPSMVLALALFANLSICYSTSYAQESPTESTDVSSAKPSDDQAAANEESAANESKKDTEKSSDTQKAENEKAVDSAKPAVDKPDIKKHTMKPELFKISFELDAIVDTPNYQTINLRTKSLKDLKLQDRSEHGQRLSKGQSILQLEEDAWVRARRNAEQALKAAHLELDQAKKLAASVEESVRLEIEAAELSEKSSREELDYFLEQGKSQQVEALEQSLKNAERFVEYSREEYEQLKKMYEADQITEESEEIVLRRAKHDLERSEYSLKATRARVQKSLEFDVIRQEASLKNAAARTKLELERLQAGRPQRLESVGLQVARAETSFETARRELAQLDEDRKYLAHVAEFDGIAFYGAVDRGQWKGASGIDDLLVEGATLPQGRVLMTIVGTEKLFVQAKLPERWLMSVKPGMTAYLELASSAENRIPLECVEVSRVPVEPGQYRAIFQFTRPSGSADLLPLLSGKIHGVVYEKENALMLPIEAVKYEGPTAFVNVLDEETGEQRRQDVSTGLRDEKRIEITQGLREGEHVVLP